MNDLFRGYLPKFILFFVDDKLIYNRTWEDHFQHLRMVLSILATKKLFVKGTKCQLGMKQVEYLGHVVSEERVSVDFAKIEAVRNWLVSTTAKAVKGFLGLAGYYGKFIQGFGGIAAPLTCLLSNEGFKWSPKLLEPLSN